jgi:UDP-N-acetylglucosamine--N-acetylmuramyl-(pentapeptide) pyrophosphoryl-undecaprenol N-acetylglucosamine transferase
MRVLISGGGTGGHVYPALAVAEVLTQSRQEPATVSMPSANRIGPDKRTETDASEPAPNSVVWIGSTGGMEEELVQRAGFEYRSIDTGQLRGKNPVTAARNAGKMLNGVRQSRSLLNELQPDVCLATGGYVCAPVVLACRQRGVPVLIYLPDMTPGSAIRWLSRLSQRVAVSLPDAAKHFGGTVAEGGKAVVTGYPVRPELVAAAQDRRAARVQLAEALGRPTLAPSYAPNGSDSGPNAELPLLLIWGGSQGSRSINQATWSALPHLLRLVHVVHIVGVRDWEMAQPIIRGQKESPNWQDEWSSRYHPVDYLHESMPWALAAADLSVARAGASILGEFPVAGLPAILVPLPIAGVGQQLNARALEANGAAIIVSDDDLDTGLAATVVDLVTEPERLMAMDSAARRLARPDAADNIARELAYLATGNTYTGGTEVSSSSMKRTEV